MPADQYDDLDDLLDDVEVHAKPSSKQSKQSNSIAKPASDDDGGVERDTATPAAVPASDAPPARHEPGKESTRAEPDVSALSLGDSEDPETLANLQHSTDELLSQLTDPASREIFEQLVAGISGGAIETEQPRAAAAGREPRGDAAATDPKEPLSFDDTIKRTMDRLNDSQKPAAASGDGTEDEDFLENLLKQIQSGAAGEDKAGLDGILASLMDEISSKEVLYGPLKEMHTKFPEWMETHGAKKPEDERKVYEKQQALVAVIVEKFEDPTYSDSDKAARKFITAKMEEMQETGAPPPELLGDVSSGAFPGAVPGIQGASMPELPSDCATQ